jgi:DNA replicative helicase MCM subunit Mcm2 (Cdc46/Mcm family)
MPVPKYITRFIHEKHAKKIMPGQEIHFVGSFGHTPAGNKLRKARKQGLEPKHYIKLVEEHNSQREQGHPEYHVVLVEKYGEKFRLLWGT